MQLKSTFSLLAISLCTVLALLSCTTEKTDIVYYTNLDDAKFTAADGRLLVIDFWSDT